jgi:hypothetical protein
VRDKQKILVVAGLFGLLAIGMLIVSVVDRPDSAISDARSIGRSPELATGSLADVPRSGEGAPANSVHEVQGAVPQEKRADSEFLVTVQVEDPEGAPVPDVEVWLAERWCSINELRSSNALPNRTTGVSGDVSLRVKSGRYCVHAWHPDYAPSVSSNHGSGEQMVLDVPLEASTRIRLMPVFVIAYQVSVDDPPIAHTLKGSGFKSLVSDLDPMFASKCEEVRSRIRARFPSAEVAVYLFTGDRAKMGQWEAHALWAGRTCVRCELIPVPLRDFDRPTEVTSAGSVESPEFGTVMLVAAGENGSELTGQSADMKRVDALPTDPFYLKVLTCKAKFGEPTALPVGSYRIVMPEHPFLLPSAQADEVVVVARGSWETKRVEFARPVQWVVLDFKLPPGLVHRPFYGRVTSAAHGTSVSLMAHLPGEAKRWWLPVGKYTYEVHMATGNVLASELFAGGEFEVVTHPGRGDQQIPIELVERMVEPPLPK